MPRKNVALHLLLLLLAGNHAYASVDNPYNDPWQCVVSDDGWRCYETPYSKPGLYDEHLSRAQHKQALMYALGWISDDSDSTSSDDSVCQGYYYQSPAFNAETVTESLQDTTSKIDYKHLQYELQGNARLTGHVEIRQPGRRIHTDEAIIYPGDAPDQIRKIEAKGHIRLRQPGQLLLGSTGVADLRSHRASINDVTYLMAVQPKWLDNEAQDSQFSGFAWGQSRNIIQENSAEFTLEKASYTTCPPTEKSWHIDASRIKLNRDKGRGYALNTWFHVHEVPVFYMPYFSFPITKERQSGFLYGDIGASKDSGFQVSLPYYFNLAPNYDYTLSPTYYSKRGVLWGNEFRFLTPKQSGIAQLDIIFDDKSYGEHRYKTNIWHKASPMPYLSLSTEYNEVSDALYHKDFAQEFSATGANLVILDRMFRAHYNVPRWSAELTVLEHQIVDDTLSLDNRPYEKLPEFRWRWQDDQYLSPLETRLDVHYTRFFKSSVEGVHPVIGERTHIVPGISLPFHSTWGSFVPRFDYLMTYYDLKNAQDTSLDRALYQLSADVVLYFDREIEMFHKRYKQTLSPKLFYLYVPYRDQQAIPVFDTSYRAFGPRQLFSRNRFTGVDRIGDTNHLAVALEGSMQNDAGHTLFSARLGQVFYFNERQVHLCKEANCLARENPQHHLSTSDFIAEFDTHLHRVWKTSVQIVYDTHANVIDNQAYQIHYHQDPHHVINFGYQANLSDTTLLSREQLLSGSEAPKLSQFTTSLAWGVSPAWLWIGKWNYSLNASRTIDMFAGIEYNTCCWSVRFVWHRYLLNNNPNAPAELGGEMVSAPMIQFELKGLGSTNAQKIRRLERDIPGYRHRY